MIRRAAIHAGLCLALAAAMPAGAVLGQADDTATGTGVGVLGADTVVLREPFETESSWMGIGSDETGENALSDGSLFSSYVVGPGNIWTDLEAPGARGRRAGRGRGGRRRRSGQCRGAGLRITRSDCPATLWPA